jgi:hypoxanthine phosphoribosyltransferase
VTWAPTSARRRRRRGYDQSELLAHAVARRLGLPCRRLLFRDRSGHQTGRSRQERLRLGPVFTARPLRKPSRVLVIDDVVTTGSTLRAAGHALDLAGAAKVVLFAAVATPHNQTSPSSPPLETTLISPSGSPSTSAKKEPAIKKPATKNRVITGQQVA